jgi:hypothetical protein
MIGSRHPRGTRPKGDRFTGMEEPELTLIRIAEIALRFAKSEIDGGNAMADVLGLLETAGVPFPTSKEEAQTIRQGYSLS